MLNWDKLPRAWRICNLLCVMELCCVSLILEFCRLHIVLESPEVLLSELCLVQSREALIERWALPLVVLCVDRCSSGLGEWLCEQVLRFDLWNVAGVAWNVLRLKILSRTSKPVVAEFRIVTELDHFACLILTRWLWVEFSCCKGWFSDWHIYIIVAGLLACFCNDLVDITSCASIDVVFLRYVACVAWQVLFPVFNVGHFSAWRIIDCYNNQL